MVGSLNKVASRDFVEFIFHEYDQTGKIDSVFRTRKMSHKDYNFWSREGPTIRRALKFIMERCVLLKVPEEGYYPDKLKRSEYRDTFDSILISAELLVLFSILSDQTYYLFPEKTRLEILPEGQDDYFNLFLTDDKLIELVTKHHGVRVAKDRQHRGDFIQGKSFDNDFGLHDSIIGDAFKAVVGVRYKEALEMIVAAHERSKPGEHGFRIRFVPEKDLVQGLATMYNTSSEAVERVLSGFMLTPENLAMEPRHYWNPKNEYRAYRRGLFRMNHPTGPHITWSDETISGGLLLLGLAIAYGTLPPEWKRPPLINAMGDLVREGGRWFEKIVARQFRKLGFQPFVSRTAIGSGQHRITFECGELDVIGYNARTKQLLIAECKMGLHGSEPKHFRDDLSDYVRKKDSHSEKFRRKIAWITSNLPSIVRAINSTRSSRDPIAPTKVGFLMITLYPSFASYFIDDFPCVSLSEFVIDFRKNRSLWPYGKGQFDCQ